MPVLSETLTVLGCGLQAASFALRETLRFKARGGSLVVHDAAGRGAMTLSASNKMELEPRRVVWVDLADRRHPLSLFQTRRSEHFRGIWARVLKSIRNVAKARIGEGALEWAADAAYALSSDGSVGLGALFRSLSSAETRRWFLDTRNEPSDLGKLLDMLAWALSFPAVHAVSEGENRGKLLEVFDKPSVLWLESGIEHFEPKEHVLVQVLVEAAVEDALRSMASEPARWADTMKEMTVLHLYPLAPISLPLESWVQADAGAVRHVGVHRLDPDRPLPPPALAWVQGSEFLWVAGRTGPLRENCHGKWLSSPEMGRIGEMASNELWIRANRSGKTLVIRPRNLTADTGMADRLRAWASRRRRVASVSQVAAAVRAASAPAGAQRDLYARLCEIETLRAAWFRVRESRSRAAGVDRVTAASFAERAEGDLTALAAALRSGQYRPRPLRRIQILKPGGGVRDLGIACIRDRVVQTACLTLLEPIFESGFSRFSYAFRPGRGAHHAIAVARSMIACGRTWAVVADIRKCFDTIDHDVLLGLLAQRIADEELLALIRTWLTVDVLEFRDLLPTEIGVPQGESLSPLLANVYLDPLDKHLERLGLAFVRYADDVVILAETMEGAREASGRLADFLRDVLRLELKPAKTYYAPVAEGFGFLGFRIAGASIAIQPERAGRLLQYLSDLIRNLGASANSLGKMAECLSRINSVVRGWRNYFLLPGEPALDARMKELDGEIDRIASTQLPDSLRENPAWLCRERLSVPAPAGGPGPGRGTPARAAEPEPGYPEASPPEVPADWKAERKEGSGRQGRAANHNVGAPNSEQDDAAPLVNAALKDGERLYILTHRTYVTANGEDLVLRKRRAEVFRRPMDEIGLIYLQGFGIAISVDAQVKLAQHDVPVVLALPLGNPVAVVTPIETARSSIRRLQAVRREDPDVVGAGIRMIAAKISNQAAVLKYFAKYRKRIDPETAVSLMESAGRILALSDSAAGLDPVEAGVRGALMGFEGHAAALYWKQLTGIVPRDLGFGGRVTLSAQDPVNQCLNYVYGLLYGEVWRAVVRAGLDPYFGLIHGSVRDQGSLVFDLIEEFRAPFGDRIVVGMMGRGFRPETGRHGFLRTGSKRQLVRGFTKRWTRPMRFRSRDSAPADILAAQAASLVRVFQREGIYLPYRMRW
ncbi:MAG: group II intron reverse transcriptase/maturase [Bryobacteraceae bacterium]|jgi:group II intron reverse transcriptase/maturase/CRISPR-associated endonuclease Cas1